METLLAYFTTFQATVEEAEQVLSLLPHVAGHRDTETLQDPFACHRQSMSGHKPTCSDRPGGGVLGVLESQTVGRIQRTSHGPRLWQGFTVSDLDLVLREEPGAIVPTRTSENHPGFCFWFLVT